METNENIEKAQCLIIGSGPAGFTAAIYTARANLNPILYEGMEPGGQLTTTTEIENFPGYPEGIDGNAMMEDLRNQAKRFKADIRWGVVTSVDLSQPPYRVTIDDSHVIETQALIIATGAKAKYLGLPDEARLMGAGVSACATCDGFFYRKKRVAVVGGGDTACEDALYLAQLAQKVYMIVRKDYLRASKIMQDKVKNNPNIEILFEHETQQLIGENKLEKAILIKRRGKEDEKSVEIEIDGFFLAIGHTPNSTLFDGYLEKDEQGYLKHQPDSSQTVLPGVFVAGDVADPHYRQAITAAGSGCKAAIDAERYLATLV